MAKILTYDELLLLADDATTWRHGRSRWFKARVCPSLFVFLATNWRVMWLDQDHLWPLGYLCFMASMCACLAIALSMWHLVTQDLQLDKWNDSLMEHWLQVPAPLCWKASSLYETTEAKLAAVECHNAHMPGDCPLCGAD